jgi:hypothetical protein
MDIINNNVMYATRMLLYTEGIHKTQNMVAHTLTKR